MTDSNLTTMGNNLPSNGSRPVPDVGTLRLFMEPIVEMAMMRGEVFTAYTLTQALRHPGQPSAAYEIIHGDVQYVLHGQLMPEWMADPGKPRYTMEWRPWFNARKNVTEDAQTYVPVPLQPDVTISLPQIANPATGASTETVTVKPAAIKALPPTVGFRVSDDGS